MYTHIPSPSHPPSLPIPSDYPHPEVHSQSVSPRQTRCCRWWPGWRSRLPRAVSMYIHIPSPSHHQTTPSPKSTHNLFLPARPPAVGGGQGGEAGHLELYLCTYTLPITPPTHTHTHTQIHTHTIRLPPPQSPLTICFSPPDLLL